MSNHTLSKLSLGIIGAGQLARMTLQSAIPLAVPIRVLSERPDDSAALVAHNVTIGSPDNPDDVVAFAAGCEVVTFDHELVPPPALRALEETGAVLRPPASTMRLAQNKRAQREVFGTIGLPVPKNRPINRTNSAETIGREFGYPVVLKAAQGGYDGRGVWVVNDETHFNELTPELFDRGVELIAESWVEIFMEIAVLIARRPDGEMKTYPVVETVQVDGICREVICPARISDRVRREAEEIAGRIAEISGVVGILAVELFVSNDRVVVNEIATRPHNSGHFTIEGCATSQFEQHLRAVLDLPLGSTDLVAPAVAMVNVLGGPPEHDQAAALADALAIEGAHIHLYGKQPRPGRKLGHVTALGQTITEARDIARRAAEPLTGAPIPIGS
jgi:5-(carboxyamino)imidazole ribonucleotide synthase